MCEYKDLEKRLERYYTRVSDEKIWLFAEGFKTAAYSFITQTVMDQCTEYTEFKQGTIPQSAGMQKKCNSQSFIWDSDTID